MACLTTEVVLTFMFPDNPFWEPPTRERRKGFAPIAIGLRVALIHLIGIPVTNLSVNPARSTAPALFVGGWALEQLWLFWVAPIAARRSPAWCIQSSLRSRNRQCARKWRHPRNAITISPFLTFQNPLRRRVNVARSTCRPERPERQQYERSTRPS